MGTWISTLTRTVVILVVLLIIVTRRWFLCYMELKVRRLPRSAEFRTFAELCQAVQFAFRRLRAASSADVAEVCDACRAPDSGALFSRPHSLPYPNSNLTVLERAPSRTRLSSKRSQTATVPACLKPCAPQTFTRRWASGLTWYEAWLWNVT